jgi:hypothetical protein
MQWQPRQGGSPPSLSPLPPRSLSNTLPLVFFLRFLGWIGAPLVGEAMQRQRKNNVGGSCRFSVCLDNAPTAFEVRTADLSGQICCVMTLLLLVPRRWRAAVQVGMKSSCISLYKARHRSMERGLLKPPDPSLCCSASLRCGADVYALLFL